MTALLLLLSDTYEIVGITAKEVGCGHQNECVSHGWAVSISATMGECQIYWRRRFLQDIFHYSTVYDFDSLRQIMPVYSHHISVHIIFH